MQFFFEGSPYPTLRFNHPTEDHIYCYAQHNDSLTNQKVWKNWSPSSSSTLLCYNRDLFHGLLLCDMSIPESFHCQFLDLSQSLIFLHLGLIQNSLFWFSWDWSQNQFFDSSWTYPYVLVFLVLGLIPESNFKEFWELSQSCKKY